MPGLDRKGPEGQGPKTGRKRGLCNSDSNEPTPEHETGRGWGRIFGRRFRWGWGSENAEEKGRGRIRSKGSSRERGRGMGRNQHN